MDKLVRFVEILFWPIKWFFSTSWIKRSLVIIVLLIIAFFVGKNLFFAKKTDYILGKVQKQTVVETVTESGIVTTTGTVSIYSPTNGVVDKVFVANGEDVKEGKALFTVKSTATDQEKTTAYADLLVAQTALKQAENTYRKTSATVDRVHDDVKNHSKDESFTQKETRTTAEVANDNAYDDVKAAQANLLSAQVDYQATQNSTVTAPVFGKVSNLSVVNGSSVKINNVLVPVVPVLVLSGLGEAEIVVPIGEGEINKVKIGQEVDIKFDAVPNKIYKGAVKRFDDSGTITSGVVKFNVYIAIAEPDSGIKPGMSTDVDIIANRLPDVLAVPNTAIKPYQKGRAVRILGKNNQLEFIPVEIGIRGKDVTQITKGLTEGQEIVTSLASEKITRKGFFEF